MKPEVTVVPKDKNPLEFLEEMFNDKTYGWLSIYDNVIDKLKEICEPESLNSDENWIFMTFASGPVSLISIDINERGRWNNVKTLCHYNNFTSHFSITKFEPQEIIFLKMQE